MEQYLLSLTLKSSTVRNYSVFEINCLTNPLETSLKPKCPYYTTRLSLFILFTAAIMKRHSEHTKHIFKYLASESNKPCKYAECSQHSSLFFFFQASYFSPEKLVYELSFTGNLLTFYSTCVPKDSPLLVLKCWSQICPH